MSIYLKSEMKDRKLVRKCQVITAILAIICAVWTLISPSYNLNLMLIISSISVGAGQLYLDKMTIWDLKYQRNN